MQAQRMPAIAASLVLLLADCGGPRLSGNETYVTVTPADDEADALPDAQKRCGTYGRIAHFKLLAFLRDKKRDRHLFDEALLNDLAERPQPDDDDESLQIALRQCLAALPDGLRLLLSRRYDSGHSIREIAHRLGKSEAAMKVALSRLRKQLMQCIERRLAESAR